MVLKASVSENTPLVSDLEALDRDSMVRSGLDSAEPFEKDAFAVGQVTIRLPLDYRPLPMLALLLSFVPWSLPFLFIADLAFSGRFSSGYALSMMLLASFLSECLLKPLMNEPRPVTSACRTEDGKLLPGMPSGHVLNCQTLLVFFTGQACEQLPASELVVVLLVLLMPVMPWARWYNGDHSFKQVTVTAALATVLGLVEFAAYMFLLPESFREASNAQEDPLVNLSIARAASGAGFLAKQR
ncbi:unnamed protein product [Polarella glacialis]|uniref:Phosphatidic acid phosphatase type 2/haloperoxidase domain-containing protein n=1 Tax=Polarella glacialis TaxID=89957 RepID=A0A813EQA8_POLGL|nr:unnamed protein product [Polarella glacialis]CAE8697326.1 unnamed protein product [Polarella glacialis]